MFVLDAERHREGQGRAAPLPADLRELGARHVARQILEPDPVPPLPRGAPRAAALRAALAAPRPVLAGAPVALPAVGLVVATAARRRLAPAAVAHVNAAAWRHGAPPARRPACRGAGGRAGLCPPGA